MSKKNRVHRRDPKSKGLDKMVVCDKCGALSYLRVYVQPKNEVEENALICSSCKFDMYPILKAYELLSNENEELENSSIN